MCVCVCIILSFSTSVLVSMAPLSQEIRSVTSCCPPHLGPPIPEVNSIWFKLWLYTRVRCGPPSILLTKGTRVKKFPPILKVTCYHARVYLFACVLYDCCKVGVAILCVVLYVVPCSKKSFFQVFSWAEHDCS